MTNAEFERLSPVQKVEWAHADIVRYLRRLGWKDERIVALANDDSRGASLIAVRIAMCVDRELEAEYRAQAYEAGGGRSVSLERLFGRRHKR